MSEDRRKSSLKNKYSEAKPIHRKRIVIVMGVAVVLFVILVGRTAWHQIVKGEQLSRAALEQQTSDNTVAAKRGKIYDRNLKVLASNVSVEKISMTPKMLKESIEKSGKSISRVAEDIGAILDVEPKDIEERINKNSNYEYLKKKAEKDIADELRKYVNDNKLLGIDFVDDVKRYYPYNNLASHIIGFVGEDNQGLEGVESIYDAKLAGIPGRVVSTRDSAGIESGTSYESYIAAQDGSSVVLTIDEVIQSYAEKHLENARIENKLEEGAAAIVMDVNTGEVLAMATKPDYDLNNPFEITDAVEQKYPNAKEDLEKLSGMDYVNKFNEVIQSVRRNKAVVDSYEPGSTFKSVVASTALEMGACSLDDSFECGGSVQVGVDLIHCSNRSGHGHQTFVEAVQNSCNPAFIAIGQKIGRANFLKGVRAFGFFEETGIELPGETTGVGFADSNFKEIDLATSSFGQSITVTPLQMITAVSAIANGGTLYKPHIIKELVTSDGIVMEKKENEVVRQVISKETSKTMCSILESVVSKGGGKNAYLAGYRIAGKTGTSEKIPRGNGKYVASFIGFAPADDPQIACLVILDQPAPDKPYYGGTIAAPVVKNIIEETLQYLGVEPRYKEDEKGFAETEVPDVSGKSVADAQKILKDAGFELRTSGSGDTVTDQIPKAHTKLAANSVIVAYLGGEEAVRSITVPNVLDNGAADAAAAIKNSGLNARLKGVSGTGYAVCSGQSPAAGTIVEPGTVVTLDFRYSEVGAD